jgi:K+/H+ antiporter YhaU regulatory subunit KhtT
VVSTNRISTDEEKQDEVFQQQNDHKSLQKIFKTQDKQIAEIAAKNPQEKNEFEFKEQNVKDFIEQQRKAG